MYDAVFALLAMVPFVGVVVGGAGAGRHAGPVGGDRARDQRHLPDALGVPGRLSRRAALQPRDLMLGLMHVAVLVVLLGVLALFFPGPAIEATEATATAPAKVQLSPVILVASALQLPLLVLFAYAPALVYWHGITPVRSPRQFNCGGAWVVNDAGAFGGAGLVAELLLTSAEVTLK